MNEPVASKALQVNLQRTAASVVIPDDQQLLLRIVEPIYGIHQDVEKLLHEINHPYVGWPETLSQLGFRALDSFDYFNRDDRGAEAIGVFNSLFAKSVNEARPHALREDALRHWLSYLEQVVELSGIHLSRNLPPLAAGLSSIASILAEEAELSVAISPRLKRFCRVLRQSEVSGPEGEKAMDLAMSLLQLSLKKVYELWLRLDDPLAWFEKHEVSSRAAMDIISHRALRGFLETLASCPEGDERAQVLLSLPDNSHVERAYIDATSAMTAKDVTSWKTDLARSEWLFMILSTNALAAVHDTALRYVVNSTSKVLREAESEEAERFLRQIFGLFRQERFHSNVAMLDAIRAIGLDVLRIGCALLSRTLYDELIDLPFNEPEIRGVNDDWQVQVNPAHLANIRTYLAIIEPDPVGGRKLITALVAQLRLGGVFLADTDLFQKDISSLLNCNIGPVYARTKQLLRVFPVFFNEIGAEGELRSVSTRIDEINSRRDPLCHFLRKQCHVESNPRLVHMTRAIGKYWATGDKSALQNLVPSSLYEALDSPFPEQEAIRAILVELGAGEDPLAEPGYAELLSRLDQESTELGQEKVRLLFKLHGLLAAKYCSSPIDVIAQLKSSQRLSQVCPPEEIEALQADLEKGDFRDALVRVLTQLDRLKELILSPEKFEAIEDIYYKRHIAVGIPSMYGRYMETKFDAMGLTFRLEALANTLFEKLFDSENLNFITKRGLILATEWLNLLIRALRIDGFRTTGLEAPISMLERANSASGISVDQYINIFQFISVSIKNHIRANYLDTYQPLFERIASSKLGRSGSEHVEELKRSETNIRELLSQSFALQQLDGLVSRILGVLSYEKEMLDLPTINLLMTYNVDRCFAPIRTSQTPHDDIIYLGNKGYHLKRLANLHYQVPFGFVMTTEVFRCLDAILGFEELLRDMESRTFRLIQRMGGLTGKRFGDPSNPLLLSVRSGAAISMPGMMDTFLNVGLNPEITEGLFAKTGASWFAWDCYRRFMQCWGMSFGMSRDLFDDLMRKTKEMHGIEKKAQLAPDAMKELAMRYRDAIREAGVAIVDDPREQLFTCIRQVLASWSSDNAKTYRGALKIAEEWGTAVIVQAMVYGNLSHRSGSGVTFTRNPKRPSEGVTLYGDFAVQSQGEDIVGGLVDTFPITEHQRLTELGSRPCEVSLEKDFNEVYCELQHKATELITVHGMTHQEIEFTFEGPKASDLYFLQTRDIDVGHTVTVQTFADSFTLEESRLGAGVGVGGGALSGRVAYTMEDIERLRAEQPDGKIILIRPDTVPDDIRLISRVDGLLTSVGGATSHAAVAALRLGRTCVVGCRQLQVRDEEGWSELAGHTLRAGDPLSIDGLSGQIYSGTHPVSQIQLHEPASQ